MRVLIIEDRPELVAEYLQVFGNMLEEDYEYTHVPTIEACQAPLSGENWDVIIIDSDLGPSSVFAEDGNSPEVKLNNGYDLVRFRRQIEEQREGIRRSYIMGIAANKVALTFFEDVGVDISKIKIQIPAMADYLKSIFDQKL